MDKQILEVVLELRDSLTPALKRAGQEGAKSARNMEKAWRQTGQNLTAVGGQLTRGLTLPIIALGGAAINAGMKFNKGMANIATLIPGNIKRVNELKGSLLSLAVDVGKSTSDLTDGLYQVISAFGDTADSVAILEINAKAATAGLATTTDAINLTSAVTKAYGVTNAAATRRAADLALMTVRLGQTTFPELAASIGRVVPVAASLGVTVEELHAGFATLTGVTGSAAEVSTQLRSILAALIKPTTDMQKAIKSLGFESGSAMIQQKGFIDTLDALIDSVNGSQDALAKMFGNVESLPAVFAFAGAQGDDFRTKLEAMGKAAGTTDVAFREVTDGVNSAGFKWEQFKAKVEVTAITLGDRLAPALIKILDTLTPLLNAVVRQIDAFSRMDPVSQKILLTLGGLAALAGPILTFAGNILIFAANIATLTTAMQANNAASAVFISRLMTLSKIGTIAGTLFLTGDQPMQGTAASKMGKGGKGGNIGPEKPKSSGSYFKIGGKTLWQSDTLAWLAGRGQLGGLTASELYSGQAPGDYQMPIDFNRTRGLPLNAAAMYQSAAPLKNQINTQNQVTNSLKELGASVEALGIKLSDAARGAQDFVTSVVVATEKRISTVMGLAGQGALRGHQRRQAGTAAWKSQQPGAIFKSIFGQEDIFAQLGAATAGAGLADLLGGLGGQFLGSSIGGLFGGTATGGLMGMIGGATGPLGMFLAPLLGGVLSKAFGGLFGGKKRERGDSIQNPVYTSDVRTGDLLAELLNITKLQRIGTAAGARSSGRVLAREAMALGAY